MSKYSEYRDTIEEQQAFDRADWAAANDLPPAATTPAAPNITISQEGNTWVRECKTCGDITTYSTRQRATRETDCRCTTEPDWQLSAYPTFVHHHADLVRVMPHQKYQIVITAWGSIEYAYAPNREEAKAIAVTLAARYALRETEIREWGSFLPHYVWD